MAKPKLGSVARFKAAPQNIEKRENLSEVRAKAIATAVGSKKYGPAKMSQLAAKGSLLAKGRRKG